METKQRLPAERLMDLLSGFWMAKSACLATQLNIPDLIGDQIISVGELACQTDTDERALYRMLRALTCVGIFDEVAPWTFANSELSHRLRADAPGSMRALFLLTGEDWKWQSWGKLEKIIRNGRFVLEEVCGYESIFEFFKKEPERGAIFDQAMAEHSVLVHAASINAYNWGEANHVVDVGGGTGDFLIELLRNYANLTGVVYDEAQVAAKAKRKIAEAGLAERGFVEAGNFFESVPSGGDIYTFGMIMHDWSDEECLQILSNVRRTIKPSGKIVLLEYVVPESKDSHFSKILDMEMMITYPQGGERTKSEFSRLFSRARFKLTHIIPTFCGSSVVEGIPL